MNPFRARAWRSAGSVAFACAVALCSGAATARDGDGDEALPKLAADVTKFSFDELLQVEVTSVSKHAEPVGAAAAAVFVLTGADIRRSGVRSIAEALRMVPGLQVAKNLNISYAISARGFANTSADKLEVLLDGRSVYSPLTSSVFWDVLDTYLPDIDRIEVIRGPGATLWGSNAVNGVINIITKSADQTQGISAAGHAGTEELYGGSARIGAKIGTTGNVRLYSQASARDRSDRADGENPSDDRRIAQTGFRADWKLGAHALTVSGDYYRADENVHTIDASGSAKGPLSDFGRSGGNLLARWTCCERDDGRWSLQASVDSYRLNEPTIFAERRRTAQVDFQQQWLFGANTLIYGAGYKNSRDKTGGPASYALLFSPASRTLNTYSAFVQDQLSLLEGALVVTAGSKFEHNSFSGFEVQPSMGFGWQVSPAWFTWAAISRAVRTPNRLDQDVAIFCPEPDGFPGICGPGLFRIGNPKMDSEKLIAYEWGARWRARQHLLIDLATYFNRYTNLRSIEPTAPLGAFANNLRADGYGAELSVVWQPLDTLEVRPFYSFQILDARPEANSGDVNSPPTLEGSTPRHQAGLVVGWDFGHNWHAQAFQRYVSELKRTSSTQPSRVPAYGELDLRLARSFGNGIEIALVGQNLLHGSHPEFGTLASRARIERGGFVELRWNW